MAQKIQRAYRSYMARVGVIRWKNRLKFACDVIGRRYKRRLELNMFKAVMAKVRKLKQAKLLQEAVHAENERVKSEAEVQLRATIFIQSWARGWRTRKKHPIDKLRRLHKAMKEAIEAGEEKKVKEMILEMVDDMPYEKGIGRPYNRKGDTYLHLAARHGNTGMCKQLVNVGEIDIDTKNAAGNTALHVCIANKKPHLARTLLRLGADVDMKNAKGSTALHVACTIAEMECVTVLLKNKADVNIKAEDGSTAMHEAAGAGRYNIMQALEQKGAKMHQPDNAGRLPIMLAIQAGASGMIPDMLKTMARVPPEEGGPYDVDYKDNEGMTMLLHAALAGEFDIARILCLEKCDVNVADKEGWTACHYAASSGDKPILEMLLTNYEADVNAETKEEKQTPLHMAADNGHKNVVPLLIKCGADTKKRDHQHRAAIHLGAQANVWEVIKMMLDCGDNLDQKDGDGWTPLIYGAANGFHKPLCTKMILANADLNKVDKKGRTALHHALEGGFEPLCGDIIAAGCNVNIVDETGTTPLLIAARKGLCKAMVQILQAGGNSHQHDDNGWNCLNHAIRNGKHHAVCLALTSMPAMHTLNDMGIFPLIQAIRELTNEETVAQVVHMTILDRVDTRGRNPLFEAIDRGQIETVRLLIEKGCRLDQFDNDGVLPIQTVWIEGDGRGCRGEWEINTWVPSEIKAMVVRATPDDLLGEGFYKDGNSAHHYACMEGNRECVVEEGMLSRIGQEFFKKRNYARKSAYDYIVPEGHPEDQKMHPDREEMKAFVEHLFKVARDKQLAEIAREKAEREAATLKIQRIARGRSKRKKFAIMYEEWQESERLRILAEEKAAYEAKMAHEIRSATQVQRIIRGLWGRRKARQRLELLREMARQEVCYREQLPYEKCKEALEWEFVPYYTGIMEESKVVSEKQDIVAEAARLVYLKRKSLHKLDSEVLNFHDDMLYVDIEELAAMIEKLSALARQNFEKELAESEEAKQRALYDAQGTAKAVLTATKPASFYEIANQRERKRCQKECGYLEEAVVTYNKVMKGDIPITSLSGDPDSVVATMYMVWQSQVAKKNEDLMAQCQLVIDKTKEALRIEWEQLAIQANIDRKNQQYRAYELEREIFEVYKDVHFKLHDDGLEEEAKVLKEAYDKVVESHYRGVTGKRNLAAIKKLASKLKNQVGVPDAYIEASARIVEGVQLVFSSHEAWDTMEEEKRVWNELRDYICRKHEIQEELKLVTDREDASGMELHKVSIEAWQLSMALYETGDHAVAEQLQHYGLATRSRAHNLLETENAELHDTTQQAMVKAIKEYEDVVDTFLKALAHDEAGILKRAMKGLTDAKNNTTTPATLEKLIETIAGVATKLRAGPSRPTTAATTTNPTSGSGSDSDSDSDSETATEAQTEIEENELDAGDIDSLDDLIDLIKDAKEYWEKELEQAAVLNQVREDHFRKAFGPRPASRAETPAWPVAPMTPPPKDPLGDDSSDEE